ncbi:MAG: pitrilysin family protein [Vicinamibacterales bacterium]|nr:pitrilysin family protein [Vicinamibacterales bacterium]
MTRPELACTKQTLANGLDVLVHEDHRVPQVAVNVWYHVGSRNEVRGRTGFAHLFEHLMFEGSAHHNHGYFAPLQQAGGSVNGSTNTDRTNYWEAVPTSALDLALWMESDRMGHLLPALTEERFTTQQAVVLNERRQNYENRPYGLAVTALTSALFPHEHPYSWMTIGDAADIRAMELSEVQAFYTRYYHPANASLTLAGAIRPDEAFALAERYFGDLPAGPVVAPVRVPSPRITARRLVLEDRVELARVYMAWHTPAMFAPGDAEMDLAADILANGKTSRLYKTLVFDTRLALDVSAYQASREMAGYALIVATVAPGRAVSDVVAAINEAVAALATEGPLASELERSAVQAESQFIYRLQTCGGFGGKSDQLNAYNVFTGDPGYFAADLARYQGATVGSVREAVAAYCQPDRSITLTVVPKGQRGAALPGSEDVVVA